MEINLKLSKKFNNSFFLECLKNENNDLIEKILNIGSDICSFENNIQDTLNPDTLFLLENNDVVKKYFENNHFNNKYNKIFNKLYEINNFNDFLLFLNRHFSGNRIISNTSFDYEYLDEDSILLGIDTFNYKLGNIEKNCFIKFSNKNISSSELDKFYNFILLNKEKLNIYGGIIFMSEVYVNNRYILFDMIYKYDIPIFFVNNINNGCSIIIYTILFLKNLIETNKNKSEKNDDLEKVLENMLELFNELKIQSNKNEKEKKIIENLLISYNEKNNNLKNQIELIKKTLSSQTDFLIDKKDSAQEINEGFNKLINIIYEEVLNNPNFVISLNSISELQKFKDNNFSYNQLKNWGIKNIKNEISKLKELGK